MQLAYQDEQLRFLCLNQSAAEEHMGILPAERLRKRLADLAATQVVSILFGITGNLRINPNVASEIVVDLCDGWQLFFQSGHVNTRTLETGAVDWAHIRRIKILRLSKQP